MLVAQCASYHMLFLCQRYCAGMFPGNCFYLNWQERQFCKRTFEEDVICDVGEIRQLIDEDIQALDEQEKGDSK